MAASAAGSLTSKAAGTSTAPHRAGVLCAAVRPEYCGFFLKPGRGLADESEGIAFDVRPRVAASARTCQQA